MLIGMTCITFFTLVLCDLSLSVQLSVGVALSDFCMDPEKAQENIIQMPGKKCKFKTKKFLSFAAYRLRKEYVEAEGV